MSGASPRELYARDLRIVESREEISLVFGTGEGAAAADAPLVINRASQVVLTPPAAKRLSRLLKDMLTRYEAVYGRIDPVPVPPPKGENFFPAGDQAAEEGGGKLLQLVDQLGVDYGVEHSMKILPGRILNNRYLMVMHRKSLAERAAEKFFSICRQLHMPPRFQKIYQEHLRDADIILFGYEGDQTGGIYKAYLEFGDMGKTAVQEFPGRPAPFLLYLGFKWAARDNQRAALARYLCYPWFSFEDVLQRMRERFYPREKSAIYEVVEKMVEHAVREMGSDRLSYLEVKEEDNPRRSYDVNFYPARLPLADFYPWLREACRIKGIGPETLDRVYEPASDKILGHVSGGQDREGRDFLTFYYGVEGRSG